VNLKFFMLPPRTGLAALCLLLLSVSAWGDDFRKSDWGATASEVLKQEAAKPLGRTEQDDGSIRLTYTEDMLGQRAEILYAFDPGCGRLVLGAFSFTEPISEGQFLSVIRAFGGIYGEPVRSSGLDGGDVFVWQDGATSIQLLHVPSSVRAAELQLTAPTSVTYWYADGDESGCDFDVE